MTALEALSDALDAAHARERKRLEEMHAMRSDMARLERRHERDTRMLARQARLIDELGSRPASEVAS